jgi:hypothetical protein
VSVEIRDLGAADVPALIDCVGRCYGESYPEHEFYDPAYLRRELRAGRLLSVGALDGSRVVGHIGARVAPGDVIAETIGGIVDPDHRGTGLTRRIGAGLATRYRRAGIAGAVHHATGAHDRTQRLIVASGGVPTGILLGHVAAETEYRGIDHRFAGARIAVVVYVQLHGELDALEVFVPPRYEEQIRDLYRQLGLERRVVTRGDVDTAVLAASTVRVDPRRGISWLEVDRSDADASEAEPRSVVEAIRACGDVVYVDVPIADPRAPALIERLVEHGFFFGALLPGGAGSERVRLQRLAGAVVAPDAVVTASEDGERLLARVVAEHARASGARPVG